MEIARTDIPVLLVGESGTGKEVFALQIHDLSDYRDQAFVKLSCAASGTENFQAQLRRLEGGSGARHGKRMGTVFLDEVGDLDVDLQRRMLQLFPDGSLISGSQRATGRVISSTVRDLESQVRAGRLRQELFYRLNGVCLKLPPLRQLREDIPNLAQFFVAKYARIFGRTQTMLSERTLKSLVEYPWPGNVRELENVARKIVVLDNEELVLSDFGPGLVAPVAPMGALGRRSLKAASRAASQHAERELILQTLARTHWNRKKAAEALQISYKSLLYKLKQIELPGSDEV